MWTNPIRVDCGLCREADGTVIVLDDFLSLDSGNGSHSLIRADDIPRIILAIALVTDAFFL
jgi:hypothetical protein